MTVITTLYGRAIRETRRILWVVAAVPLIVPTFMLTVFASVFAPVLARSDLDVGGNYTQYVAPGAILMATMLSATGAVSVAVERQNGFYDRMRISPAGPRASNISRRLADGTKLLGFSAVLVIVSVIAGAPVRNWPALVLLGVVMPAVWGVVYGGFAFAACLWSARAEYAEAILPAFFPLLFLSSAFVPLQQTSGWQAAVAQYNPLTYLCDAIRSAYTGALDGRAIGISIATLLVTGVVTQMLIALAERRASRQ